MRSACPTTRWQGSWTDPCTTAQIVASEQFIRACVWWFGSTSGYIQGFQRTSWFSQPWCTVEVIGCCNTR